MTWASSPIRSWRWSTRSAESALPSLARGQQLAAAVHRQSDFEHAGLELVRRRILEQANLSAPRDPLLPVAAPQHNAASLSRSVIGPPEPIAGSTNAFHAAASMTESRTDIVIGCEVRNNLLDTPDLVLRSAGRHFSRFGGSGFRRSLYLLGELGWLGAAHGDSRSRVSALVT